MKFLSEKAPIRGAFFLFKPVDCSTAGSVSHTGNRSTAGSASRTGNRSTVDSL
ncbi:hypothetical protein [Capnocytophaga ochracea]|uniref:hypothetical protein n=1 Tax=Capnocytophaga ochracea TaxID=1018 RepID=UPI001364A603|nr:hypothetical protein [Capnocytophaga ochracea]